MVAVTRLRKTTYYFIAYRVVFKRTDNFEITKEYHETVDAIKKTVA